MPVVTVLSNPRGDPTATTCCPTRRSLDDPIAIGVNPDVPCARTTAMSLVGSVATTVKGAVRPSANITTVCAGAGPAAAALAATDTSWLAAATTWLFVRISPSAVKTMPEPCSLSLPRSVCSCTTLGTTFAATCSTEFVDTPAAGTGTAAVAVAVVPSVDRYGCTATAATPPMDADITATASPATTNGPRREGVCCVRCAGYTRSNSTGACATSP